MKKKPAKKSDVPNAAEADPSEDARKHRSYQDAEKKASAVAKDPEKLAGLVAEAEKKASEGRNPLKAIWEEVQTLFRMVGCYARGEYREVPVQSITLIAIALTYFLTPIDLIPDAILGLGLVDDVGVLAWTISQIKADIEKFRKWEGRMKDEG